MYLAYIGFSIKNHVYCIIDNNLDIESIRKRFSGSSIYGFNDSHGSNTVFFKVKCSNLQKYVSNDEIDNCTDDDTFYIVITECRTMENVDNIMLPDGEFEELNRVFSISEKLKDVPLTTQDISIFDLEKWRLDVKLVRIETFETDTNHGWVSWKELIEFFDTVPVPKDGWFVKCHHSFKDHAIKPVRSISDVLILLDHSDKISDDLTDDICNSRTSYLRFVPFRTDWKTENEARVFFYDSKPLYARWADNKNNSKYIDLEMFKDVKLLDPRCCIDIMMSDNLKSFEIVEYNPFDHETDLFLN